MNRATKLKDGKPVISEKVFQEQVRKAALLTGWKYYHTFNSFRSTEGFPDCVLLHPKKGRMIVAELKTETGLLNDKQGAWLDAFRLIPCAEVFLLRPSDLDWFWEVLKK